MIVSNITKFQVVFGLLLLTTLFLSCLKSEDYPAEPQLTFKRIDFDASNNATLYLNFIDGDGDFGLDESDWDMSSDSCTRRYNLFVKQFELQNNQWVDVTPGCELVRLFYRVPWAKPTGQIQTQKGEIKVNLSDFWYSSLTDEYDTIRFEINILDRRFNTSNIVTTGIYLKP